MILHTPEFARAWRVKTAGNCPGKGRISRGGKGELTEDPADSVTA